jgi:hypothetical protein
MASPPENVRLFAHDTIRTRATSTPRERGPAEPTRGKGAVIA